MPIRVHVHSCPSVHSVQSSFPFRGQQYRVFHAVHFTAGSRRHIGYSLREQQRDWEEVEAQVVAVA